MSSSRAVSPVDGVAGFAWCNTCGLGVVGIVAIFVTPEGYEPRALTPGATLQVELVGKGPANPGREMHRPSSRGITVMRIVVYNLAASGKRKYPGQTLPIGQFQR